MLSQGIEATQAKRITPENIRNISKQFAIVGLQVRPKAIKLIAREVEEERWEEFVEMVKHAF